MSDSTPVRPEVLSRRQAEEVGRALLEQVIVRSTNSHRDVAIFNFCQHILAAIQEQRSVTMTASHAMALLGWFDQLLHPLPPLVIADDVAFLQHWARAARRAGDTVVADQFDSLVARLAALLPPEPAPS